MAEVDDSLVFQGFWINHDNGPVLGATITTRQQAAYAVVALIAIVVASAATSAWNILLFAVHQIRATPDFRDGLFRQQQVMFRSLATPGTVFTDSIKMLSVWRKTREPSLYLRCLVPAVIGLVFALASMAAGVFSSSIVNTSNLQVLVRNSECRIFNSTAYYEPEEGGTNLAFDNIASSTADSYATECYEGQSPPSQCQIYVVPRIQVLPTPGECPFSSAICELTRAIILDTGYLDSDQTFGLNAPPQDRVFFRRKAICAPLVVQQHLSTLQPEDIPFADIYYRSPLPGEILWNFNYGGNTQSAEISDNLTDSTFLYSTITSNVTQTYTALALTAYGSSNLLSQLGEFTPIQGLDYKDADISTIFIFSNAVRSAKPIDDPVYAAHQEGTAALPGFNVTYYHADKPAGVVGCTEQYEYCVPHVSGNGSRECSGLHGTILDGFEQLLPSANQRQLATLNLFAATTSISGFAGAFADRSHPYLANVTTNFGDIQSLPDNQWELDVAKAEGYVRAEIQTQLAMHVTGYPSSRSFTYPPSTAAQMNLCRSQKVVKTGGFANINVFGLCFSLAFFGLVVTLDFGLRFLLLLEKPGKPFKIRYWIQDGSYQLQRFAYEAQGVGKWSRQDKELPITPDLLADLPSGGASTAPQMLQPLSTTRKTSPALSPNGAVSSTAPVSRPPLSGSSTTSNATITTSASGVSPTQSQTSNIHPPTSTSANSPATAPPVQASVTATGSSSSSATVQSTSAPSAPANQVGSPP